MVKRSRVRLPLALVLARGGRRPRRRRRPGASGRSDSGYLHWGLDLTFVGAHRLLVAEDRFDVSPAVCRGQVWSLDTGAVERTLPRLPSIVDVASGWAVVSGDDHLHPLEEVDLATGERRPWLARTASPVDAIALSPGGDVVALLCSTTVELHATRDGALLRALPIPRALLESDESFLLALFEPSLAFSPRGDRLAVTTVDQKIAVGDLATGTWTAAPDGWLAGFAPGGVVVDRLSLVNAGGVVLAARDGSVRAVVPAAQTSLSDPVVVSASGEWLAYAPEIETATRRLRPQVIVVRIDSGEVVRRVPVAHADDLDCLALSPDGERLAVAHRDENHSQLGPRRARRQHSDHRSRRHRYTQEGGKGAACMNRRSLQPLEQRVRAAHPTADVKINETPGGLWLDAKLAGTTIVLEARNEHEIGVSAVGPGDANFGGHDEEFTSIKEASDYFLVQLNRIFGRAQSHAPRANKPSDTGDGSSEELSILSSEEPVDSGAAAAEHLENDDIDDD